MTNFEFSVDEAVRKHSENVDRLFPKNVIKTKTQSDEISIDDDDHCILYYFKNNKMVKKCFSDPSKLPIDQIIEDDDIKWQSIKDIKFRVIIFKNLLITTSDDEAIMICQEYLHSIGIKVLIQTIDDLMGREININVTIYNFDNIQGENRFWIKHTIDHVDSKSEHRSLFDTGSNYTLLSDVQDLIPTETKRTLHVYGNTIDSVEYKATLRSDGLLPRRILIQHVNGINLIGMNIIRKWYCRLLGTSIDIFDR
jgi:hypothetical protein